jgi:hypothetical protein
MFIGSSSEGLPVANALQAVLVDDVEAETWKQGLFVLSQGYLESLTAAMRGFDFAALVLTPDDVVEKREAKKLAARDNVLFEAGLFMGALGRERTYLVACADDKLDFPSDFAGVSMAKYRRRSDGKLQAALGPVAEAIRAAMKHAQELAAKAERDSDPATARTVAAIETMRDALARQFPGAPLRPDQAAAYASLLEAVRRARPGDVLATGLPEPSKTAVPGVYGMTAGDAVNGLGLMHAAMVGGA